MEDSIPIFSIQMTASDCIKILFLAADPSDTVRLRLGQELRDIREKLQRAKLRNRFVLESREAVRPGDITQAIFDVEPQIVHFSGHGINTGELCFENDAGKIHSIGPEALAGLFELIAEQVKCVILNACYSEAQAKAIAQHIPYVVGMCREIGDKAAITFATGFYKALGANRTVEQAYKFGCLEIQLQNIPEHLTPVLQKKDNLENKSKNTKFVLVLSATIDEIDKPLAEAMVEHLRQISGDASLTLRKVEPGSVRLILDGSQDGFERLEILFREGQLAEILGVTVQDIQSTVQGQHGISENAMRFSDSDSDQTTQEQIADFPSNQSLQKMVGEPSQHLQSLAEEAKQAEPRSRQQLLALKRLIEAILRSKMLVRPERYLLPIKLYEYFYREAIQMTLLQVSQRIQDYNPTRSSVMAWINALLQYNFRNITRDYEELKYGRVATLLPARAQLDLAYGADSSDESDLIVALRILSQEDADSSDESDLIVTLRNLLQEDPENRFRRRHLTGHPDVTFQSLALARLDGQTWEELSRISGVPITALATYYNRQLERFVPYFQAYLQE